jgi:hypothetical protein
MESEIISAGGGVGAISKLALVSKRRTLGERGGELGGEGAEQGQRPYCKQFVFHSFDGRGFTELELVSSKLEVHGLGTRKENDAMIEACAWRIADPAAIAC